MTTLEKIRAEILFKNRYQFFEYGIDTYLKIDDVLAVIDKYAEQEPCETIHGSTYGGVSWGGAHKPQDPCDDAVSRQAVEEIINDIRDCISVEGYYAILERLKKLPSMCPAEKGGE